MMTIEEYAHTARISPRAVRAKAQKGLLQAHKVGRIWVIDESPRHMTPTPGRPLTAKAFDELALFADGVSQTLTPQGKHRARQRLQILAQHGLEKLSVYAKRPHLKVAYLSLPTPELTELHKELAPSLTGISHPLSGVSGPLVDAYISSEQFEELSLFYSFTTASKNTHNVHLRIGHIPPKVCRLHVCADLLDDPNPRSQQAAHRLFQQVIDNAQAQ